MKLAEFFPYWPEVRRALFELIDLIPEEDLLWAPIREMMPFSGHVLHISETTDFWIGHVVLDRPYKDLVLNTDDGGWKIEPGYESKSAMIQELNRTFESVHEVLAWDAEKRTRPFRAAEWTEDKARELHWILHHVLDHEIHHRAYIAAFLRLRGIAPRSKNMP